MQANRALSPPCQEHAVLWQRVYARERSRARGGLIWSASDVDSTILSNPCLQFGTPPSTMSGLGARGRVVGFLNNKHGQTIDLLRIHFTHSPPRSSRVRPLLCVRREMNDKTPKLTSEAEKFVQSLEQEELQLDSDPLLRETLEDSKPASELETQYNRTLKDVGCVFFGLNNSVVSKTFKTFPCRSKQFKKK